MKNKKYKDSGIPWIGMIPEDWEVCKVKHHYNFTTGFTPPSKNDQYYDENGIPWVTISELNGERYITRSTKGISKKYVEVFNPELVAKGSLLYSFKLSVGQVAITQIDLFTNEALAAFQDSDKICLEYLYYSSQYFIEKNANENIYGAKLLNQDLIKNAIILFPPLPTQQRIADFLDKKCAEIDELAALQETMIAELKRYKQSVITEAVTKGLDKNVKLKDSGVEWIGEIPEGWEMKKVKNITTEISKGNGITKEEVFADGDTPCVRYGEIYSKYDSSFVNCISKTKKDVLSTLHYFGKGDILCAGTGELVEEIGKSIVYLGENQCLAGGDIIVLRHCQNPLFLNFALNSKYAQAQKSCSKAKLKVVHISAFDIGNILIALPPLTEQQRIADYFDEKCNTIDELIAIKQQKIEQLKEYKKSVIFEYVTGKKEI